MKKYRVYIMISVIIVVLILIYVFFGNTKTTVETIQVPIKMGTFEIKVWGTIYACSENQIY